jgi:hypothetical protein
MGLNVFRIEIHSLMYGLSLGRLYKKNKLNTRHSREQCDYLCEKLM